MAEQRHTHATGAWPSHPVTHMLYNHPEVARLDPDWEMHPVTAHEAIHRMWEAPENAPSPEVPEVGDTLYGFCHGYFGRDSYSPKTVLHVGRDYVVVREQDQHQGVLVANCEPRVLGDCLTDPDSVEERVAEAEAEYVESVEQ